MYKILLILSEGELQQTRQELQLLGERADRQRELLEQRIAQLDKELQQSLQRQKQAHNEDIDRIAHERVYSLVISIELLYFSSQMCFGSFIIYTKSILGA